MNPTPFEYARSVYGDSAVDVEAGLAVLAQTPISLQCWQGDDVGGFERPGATLDGGGIQVTGRFLGKARSNEELRADLGEALRLIPGKHRVNLHASYGDFGGHLVERSDITPAHFSGWIEWAKERGLGLDFNPTLFSHPLADDGFTLSHSDSAVRAFWIAHATACRRIAAEMGRALGKTAVTNVWIPTAARTSPLTGRAPGNAWRMPSTRSSPSRSTPGSSWTRWRASCSASAPRAMSSGPMNFTWGTPSPGRSSSASTLATSIRPSPSPTRSAP